MLISTVSYCVLLALMFLCTTTSAIHQDACNYQQRVCECDPGEQECHFSLIVEDLLSLASYKLDRSPSGQLRRRNNAFSTNYNIIVKASLFLLIQRTR